MKNDKLETISNLFEGKEIRSIWDSEKEVSCTKISYNWKWNHGKDEKNYLTDTLDTKGILRLIESIPSSKAEPFKLWLAKLGLEWKQVKIL